jgi:hypothetical protein
MSSFVDPRHNPQPPERSPGSKPARLLLAYRDFKEREKNALVVYNRIDWSVCLRPGTASGNRLQNPGQDKRSMESRSVSTRGIR